MLALIDGLVIEEVPLAAILVVFETLTEIMVYSVGHRFHSNDREKREASRLN